MAAFAGIASAVIGAGVGELLAAFVAASSTPFAVVGGALIDAAPAWAKDTAIAWFGTADKVALLVGIGVVLIAAAAAAGLCEARWRRSGVIAFVVIGAGVAGLALTRPDAGMLAWLPSLSAGAAGAWALNMLAGRLPGRPDPDAAAHADLPTRRRFLAWAGGTAALGIALTIAGSVVRAGTVVVTSVRDALRLPPPATPAPAPPAGAALDVP